MGGTALGIEVDVRDYEPVEAMVAQVVQDLGPLGITANLRKAAQASDCLIRTPFCGIRLDALCRRDRPQARRLPRYRRFESGSLQR